MNGLWLVDAFARETMLFAATGLLIGGLDDLLVDLCLLVHRLRRGSSGRMTLADLPSPATPGRIAVFIGAWDEVAVIGPMLTTALARYDHPDYRLYVGVYPNDRPTVDAVASVAERDARVRIVVNPRPGPTTKADNLNAVWRAMQRDDARDGRSTKLVLLHDAEDVVHPAELRVVDALIEGRVAVQLPVLPLIKGGSLISGHYADEFAECHLRQLVVRNAIGAAMPLAGTGCAIATDVLATIAAERGGDPFDATSLTEDYELGLRIAEQGGVSLLARVAADDGLVAVRAYFPDTLRAATKQKARWMTGIALAGWDRTGWARRGAFLDHWMRMRDRRGPLAVLVLAVAYVAILAFGLQAVLHFATNTAPPDDRFAGWLAGATTLLLWWRLAVRMTCTGRVYGWRQGLVAVPRFVVGNAVSLIAAPRAMLRYLALLRGGAVVWDKTRHEFPTLGEAAAG